MRTKILVVALALVLVIGAGVVSAQGPRGGKAGAPGMGMGMGMGMGFGPQLAKDLNLTPDQIKQVQKLHADFMASTQGTREQLKTKMQELGQLWAQDGDANQLKAKFAEIDTLRADLRDAGIDFALQVRSILTDEQRTKVRQMMKNMPGFGAGLCGGLGMGCGMCGQGQGMGPGAGMGCPLGAPGEGGNAPAVGPGACPTGKGGSCCPK
ncbi:MAG: Spy/CpxP family protein refolding chaperone [Armatimonadota bacterium]